MAEFQRRGRRPVGRFAARRLHLQVLENRFALTGYCDLGTCVSVDLLPEFDTFGNQIETVQAFGEGPDALVSFSIYDTGASVITWSANDQLLFQLTSPTGEGGIPIKVPGGAGADAIGGGLQGDVSQPSVILADGLHAIDFESGIDFSINFENPARAEGVQSFVGTTNGSPQLPTITGVPIHYPSPSHTGGVAARIDMNAYEYDLGKLFPEFGELFEDLVLYAPDIFFVDSGQVLEPSAAGDTTAPFRIPLDLWGEDNHANPGDDITYVKNPVQSNVFLGDKGVELSGNTLLFDTGAQLSVISTELALSLGLNLDLPTMSIGVHGAAGSLEIPGFFIDELQLPIDNNGDATFDGGLQFNNVPIFVLDIVPGLDGIIGMNLFNTSDVMLYDPFDPLGPSLQTRFFTDLVRDPTEFDTDLDGDGVADELAVNFLSQAFPTLAASVPGGTPTFANLGLGNPVTNAAVVGRHLFLNNSAFDGYNSAITAADDSAMVQHTRPLYPGGTATSQNVIGSGNGITGVVVDIASAANPAAISLNDFEFRFGNTAHPTQWQLQPQPELFQVRPGAGPYGSDRIAFTFTPETLTNGWLEVRVRASEATGLEFDDVFYFGSQRADVTGDGMVDATDFNYIRTNPRTFQNLASTNDGADLNGDRLVNASDLLMVRDHRTLVSTGLNKFTPPPADLGGGFMARLTRHTNPESVPSTELVVPTEILEPRDESTFQLITRCHSTTLPEPLSPGHGAHLDILMAAYGLRQAAGNTEDIAGGSPEESEDLPLELLAECQGQW